MFRDLLILGVLLLPFSTGKSEHSYVVSYGLPFLMLFAVLFLLLFSIKTNLRLNDLKYIGAGILIFFSQLLAWIHTPDLVQSGYRLFANFIGLLIFLYLISYWSEPLTGIEGQRKIRPLLKLLIASATIMACYYIVHFTLAVIETSWAEAVSQRYMGGIISLPWGASNTIASPMLTPFFLAFYMASISKNQWRYCYLTSAFVILLAIGLTFSRGAFISLIAGIIVLGIITDFKSKTQIIKTIILLIILIMIFSNIPQIFGGGFNLHTLGNKVIERFNAYNIQDLNGRYEIWSHYFGIISQNLLFGTGYYSSLYLYGYSAHNYILTTLAERGFVGLLMVSLGIAYPLLTVIYNIKRDKPYELRKYYCFLGSGLLASFLHLMVEDANFTQPYIIYFWIVLALIFVGQAASYHCNNEQG